MVIQFVYLQPNFGASLHILKVEIGGDGQSTGSKQYLLNYVELNFQLQTF